MKADSGVSSVIGAILVLAGLATFFAVYNAQWVPVRVESQESQQSLLLRQSLSDWASTAEEYTARAITNRPFSRSLPIAAPVTSVGSRPTAIGMVSITTTPTLTVFRDAVQIAQASGGLEVNANYQRFPSQTYRYQVGGLITTQGSDSWVDVRSFVTAARASQGTLTATVTALSLSGGPASQGGTSSVQVVGTVQAVSQAAQSSGNVRLLVDGVDGPAWKSALSRHLGNSGLTGDELSDCTGASTNHYCFDTDTTDADTVDLLLRNVAAGWILATGTVQVTLQA